MNSWRRQESGFTLVEIMVTVLIIGILTAIAVPAFLNQREKAIEGAMKSELSTAGIEVEQSGKIEKVADPETGFRTEQRVYPTSLPDSLRVSDQTVIILKHNSNSTQVCLEGYVKDRREETLHVFGIQTRSLRFANLDDSDPSNNSDCVSGTPGAVWIEVDSINK